MKKQPLIPPLRFAAVGMTLPFLELGLDRRQEERLAEVRGRPHAEIARSESGSGRRRVSWGWRGQGQGEVELGAVAEFALGPDAAAVGLDDVLDDGEAEAGAAGFTGAGLVHTVESLEDAVEVLGGDAGAEVLDSELDGIFSELRADADTLARASVFEGVFNQVSEDLVHGIGIGHDEVLRRAGKLEFDAGVDHYTA